MPQLRLSLMLGLSRGDVPGFSSCFATSRKRTESELKDRFSNSEKGGRFTPSGIAIRIQHGRNHWGPRTDVIALNGTSDPADQDGDGLRVGIASGHSRWGVVIFHVNPDGLPMQPRSVIVNERIQCQ